MNSRPVRGSSAQSASGLQHATRAYDLRPYTLLTALIGGLLLCGIVIAGCQRTPPAGMVLIPAGEFLMGTDDVDEEGLALDYGIVKPWYEDEHPSQSVHLDAYFIDQYEVTNAQYLAFLQSANYPAPSHWSGGRHTAGHDYYPINKITWENANAYCAWAGKSLPTETQWEKAARGIDGRNYPWGNTFEQEFANVGGLHGGISPIGSFEAGKSPYGVHDMIGNVWEWTADWYLPYPGNTLTDEFFETKFGNTYKAIRGLSWSPIGHYPAEDTMIIMSHYSRITYRLFFDPQSTLDDVGFRCVKKAT